MPIQLSDATVVANNEAIGIVPNSLSWTEGFGEQTMRAMSIGGGAVEQVFSNDLQTNFSMLKFSMPSTVDNIKLARQWKANRNTNVFQVAGSTVDGDVTRVFTSAAVVNNFEVPVGSEANIEIEVHSNSAL